ncbi:MAG TPA: glycosyltransferase family 2 protein [Lacipirellulaceae bacterium]|jgi:glycosyltransferase involved in cell wall biosynthesis|nr:glycosyltransferase family 2 protein [Lacipirellulaceae bacterium]
MNLADITPLILTWNEEANIGRTLAGLTWAARIVVVDSGSTDGTAAVVARHPNAKLVVREFDNHTAQWNFGLDQVDTPWVLALDADYLFPESFVDELQRLAPSYNAYEAKFRYCIEGRPLRGTLYPARVVLFRTCRFRYRQDGHTQLLDVNEQSGRLKTAILHDDRKPLSRWLAAQSKYADLEVKKLLVAPPTELGWKDRLRKLILFAAPLTFAYCLLYKRLIFDGWTGIYYTLQRTYAEFLLSLKLLDAKLTRRTDQSAARSRQVEEQCRPAGGDTVADGGRQMGPCAKVASETPSTFELAPSAERRV